MSDDRIYNALYELRERLRAEGKEKSGRMPVICNDDTLQEIAEMKPKTLDDLGSIQGIGKVFLENYGQRFLDCIKENDVADRSRVITMDDSCCNTLKRLSQKLVNLNAKNMLLFCGKKQLKKLADTYRHDRDVRELIYGSVKSFVLCDSKGCKPGDYELRMYNASKTVVREADKILRDQGHNDLYLAYPFVIGKLAGEDFDVRAPLALIPVNADKTATKITLTIDDSRDALFNNTLLLAYYKFNQMDRELPEDDMDDTRKEVFLQNILNYFDDNGLEISLTERYPWGPFQDYNRSEFPSFGSGELFIENAAALGVFPTCSNSIQRDFDTMVATREANDLLLDLIRGYDEQSDFYAESFAGVQEIKTSVDDIPEKELLYINDLNSAQEKVLYMMKNHDELVIQGPPGTGKSQTIASLITEFVNNGKTVLMVSEKRTALDVVYSRLGNLSKYSLLIDDVGNKQTFYEQMGRMMDSRPFSNGDTKKIEELNRAIDANISRLKEISSKIYSTDSKGYSQYALYSMCTIDMSQPEYKNLSMETANKSTCLPNLHYDELVRIHNDFRNPMLFNQISRFEEIRKRHPYVAGIPGGYSELELTNIRPHLEDGMRAVDEYNAKGFFGRLFGKGTMRKQVMNAALMDFDPATAQKVAERILANDISPVMDSIDCYDEYQSLKPVYDGFGPNSREYMRVMETIPELVGDRNDFLFNNILYWHIKRFESQNRDAYKCIDDFDSILKELSDSMQAKRRAVQALTETTLAYNVSKIRSSKRFKEFDHELNTSKRKWPVNKFIRRFRTILFDSVKVWMMTPEVVSEILPLASGLFDLLIFDEASQMFVEKGLPSMFRAKKVVVAGDHKQLRPNNLFSGRIDVEESEVEDTDVSAALEEESLLDLARAKFNDVLLNFHYRSRYEELIAFSNHAFYDGRLYVSPNAVIPQEPPITVFMTPDAQWIDRTNRQEAEKVVETIRDLLRNRQEGETIGVITFNSDQRDLIEDLLDDACKEDQRFSAVIEAERNRKSEDGEDIGLFVKNIENVQGDERDIIIFSIGYAKGPNGRLVQRFGWLNQKGGENRLNVAISRAKRKIFIVLSFEPEELQVESAKNDGPKILKKYLRYAKAVSDGNEDLAKEILMSLHDGPSDGSVDWFDSPFEQQVCEALRAKGYDVRTQVGVGGYRIDMAVVKDGRYVLGIECDGKLYHSSASARDRDYHRQKYLESRGWKVHRIWSSSWWNNPLNEIEKISRLVESA